MAGSMVLTEGEVDGLQRLVAEAGGDEPGPLVPWSALAALQRVVGCDSLNLMVIDRTTGRVAAEQPLPADGLDGDAFVEHYRELPPEWRATPTSRPRSAVASLSDFCSRRWWRGTGMYREYFLGTVDSCLRLDVSVATAANVIEVAFFRGASPDFSDRDRTLLALVGPHLARSYHDAERRRAGVVPLTLRQEELLRLVAAGYTNAQAARRLGISAGTVRKHLENAFERLGVHSRTAALTRAGIEVSVAVLG